MRKKMKTDEPVPRGADGAEPEGERVMDTPPQTLREKIASEIQVVAWDAFEDHLKRSALILVGCDLDLVDVAWAISEDQAAIVSEWIETDSIRKPSEEEIATYQKEAEIEFRFVIVQPFVLAQVVSS